MKPLNAPWRLLPKALRRAGEGEVSQKTLGRVCAAVFALSLLPLILIALYNYPADDDFFYALDPARAWLETGSPVAALRAVAENTLYIYQTWQGNFASTFLFGISPLVFGVEYYFLSSWALLALLCLSVGYLVKGVVLGLLKAGRSAFWICYVAMMILILQFMPAIGYSVFWHNGGMYTAAACTLFLLQGVLIRSLGPQSRGRAVWRCCCAGLAGFLLGGSFYGPMLGALVLVTLETAAAFCHRSKNRAACGVALGCFLLALIVSVAAPGNLLRQERTGEALSPVMAVITAVLDSFDQAGRMMTPQLLAALLLICPALWLPLKESPYGFRRPLWFFVMLYGLFSAALVPGVYTGFGYTTERYMNVVYFYFLLMAVGSAVYFEGALIRRLEKQSARCPASAAALTALSGAGQRFPAALLALSFGLFVFGGFGYTITNTASLSAARSLFTGEAAQFRQEMALRQEAVRLDEREDMSVEPLSVQPHVFKEDKLPWQGSYGRIRYMKWYFMDFKRAEEARAEHEKPQ